MEGRVYIPKSKYLVVLPNDVKLSIITKRLLWTAHSAHSRRDDCSCEPIEALSLMQSTECKVHRRPNRDSMIDDPGKQAFVMNLRCLPGHMRGSKVNWL